MNRTALSLALLSLSVVAFEIHLMHVFSVVQWSHFASMFISIALLGFGASGTVLSLFRKKLTAAAGLLIPLSMILCGLFMALSLPLSRTDFFLFDAYTLFIDGGQFGKFAASYLLFFLPFFFAGSAIGLIFIKWASTAGRYYFADLLGAGLGGLFAILLLWHLEFDRIALVISAFPVIAGWISVERRHWSLMAGSLFFLIAVGMLWNRPVDQQASSYKSISYALQLPEAVVEEQNHSPYGWVQVVSAPMLRYAPGLSLTYQKQVGPVPVMFKNGNWYSSIPVRNGNQEVLLDHTTMSLPFWLRSPERVLQLGAGAGLEVAHALANGAQKVDAIEPDAVVLSLLQKEYAKKTDSLFQDPRTSWHATTARTHLEGTSDRYDLVQLPLLGSFGGSVGLESLQEDHILTREGFSTIWTRLNPEGMIALSCWIEQPQNMSLKLTALIRELLEEQVASSHMDHLIAVKSWGTMTFVLSKSAITDVERQKVSDQCQAQQFDLLDLYPANMRERPEGFPEEGMNGEGMNGETYNVLENKDYINNLMAVFGEEKDSLLAAYPYFIRPPTDNRPYFFQFLKLANMPRQYAQLGGTTFAFSQLGYLIVLITLVQVVALSLLLILLPLFGLAKKGKKKTAVIVYFSALGMGFMFVEIVLIKYFSLYLAHPIYAVAAVISTLLISSGLGSRYSENFGLNRVKHQNALLLVALLILAYVLLLGEFLSATVGLPPWTKAILSVFLIGIPGFFMGMPFPLGLKKIEASDPAQIPWAWGINGCISVVSSIAAVVLAVEMGFATVLLFGALAYLLAYTSLKFMPWPS